MDVAPSYFFSSVFINFNSVVKDCGTGTLSKKIIQCINLFCVRYACSHCSKSTPKQPYLILKYKELYYYRQ